MDPGPQGRWNVLLKSNLKAITRNAGQGITGNDKDIAVGVSERVERRSQDQRISEGGVDVGVVGVDVPAILFIGRVGFDAPPQRVAGVLKELMPYDRARDREDVVGIERVK